MSELSSSSSNPESGEPPLLLAQASPAPTGTGAVAGEAAKVAQSEFSEALSSGKSADEAIARAVEAARQEALARGLDARQADTLALQVREALNARAAALPGLQQTGNAPPADAGAARLAPGSAPGPADASQPAPSAPSAGAPVPAVNPLQSLAPGARAETAVNAPDTLAPLASPLNMSVQSLAPGPAMVDAGGGLGTSSLSSFSRSIGSQVGVDSGGSVNVTGLIAPYLEQRVATGGGLVTALADRFDVRATSAGGGDPVSVQSRVEQVASLRAAASQVGGGSVSLVTTEVRQPLAPAASSPITGQTPIRVPPVLEVVALSPTLLEGHEGVVELRYTVTRTGDLSEVDRVKWSVKGLTAGDLALQGALQGGELVFQPRVDAIEIVVRIAANRVVEADRAIGLQISDPVNARLGLVTEATTTVLNDDSQYAIARADGQAAVVQEGSDGAGLMVVFAVTRSGNLDQASWVDYKALAPSELDSDDFAAATLPQGRVSFSPGQSLALVTVRVQPDQTIESDEKLVLTLTEASYPALISNAQVTVTIENDDVRFDVARASGQAAQLLEGTAASGATAVVFEVTKTGDVTTERTVKATASGLSAQDFVGGQLPEFVLTFAASQTAQLVTLQVLPDALVEGSETLVLSLSEESQGATVGTRSASVVIENDDVRFDIARASGQPAQVLEGTAGTGTPVVFEITKTGEVAGSRMVKLTASGLSADDFVGDVLPDMTLTFAPGQTVQRVTLQVKADAAVEAHEALILSLSEESDGATVGTRSATVTIENDDVSWAVQRQAASVLEGNTPGGRTPVVFTVTKTGTVSSERTVDVAVTGLSPGDFDGGQLPAGTLTFGPGETSRQVTIYLAQDDAAGEGDETLTFSLSNASSGASITTASAQTVVYNDDLSVSVSAIEPDVRESDLGQETRMVFRITRTEGLNAREVDWTLNLAGIEAQDLLADPGRSGTIVFAPGQTEAFITVSLKGNEVVGSAAQPPQATLTLGNPSNGMQLGQASQTITVVDNDVHFAIQADQASVLEGAAGDPTPRQLVFTVTRESAQSTTDTVQWRVLPSSDANPADFVAGQDALANAGLPSGTVTFTGAQTSVKITLAVAGDDAFGADESVILALSNPSRGILTQASASSVVLNDDAPYSVAVVGSSVQFEGSDAASAAQFVFSVSRPAHSALLAQELLWSVKAAGTLDSAASADDFAPASAQLPSGLVSFAPGATEVRVTIAIAPDSRMEGTESFVLALADTAETRNATIAVPLSPVVQIQDDDAAYRVDAVSAIHLEGSQSGATQAFVFQVSREGYLGRAATVTWDVRQSQDGASADAADFATGQPTNAAGLPTGQVVFSAGQATATFTVLVAADADYEPNESFEVAIGAADEAGMSFIQRCAQGLVFNDEIGLVVRAVAPSLAEGDVQGAGLVFVVERQGVTQSASTVEWRVLPDDAAALTPDDFLAGQNTLAGTTLPSGVISFTAGEASRLITLQVAPDTDLEGHEGFVFQLSNPSTGSQILTASASASGSVLNDDAQIQLDPLTTPSQFDEGNGGSQPLVLRVLREGSTEGTDTVAWSLTATGTQPAALPGDLTGATAGVLTFASGSSVAVLTLNVVADGVQELDETFTLTLGATSLGASLKPGGLLSQDIRIVNDDSTVTLQPVVASVNEGSPEQGGALVYEIVRTGALRAGTVSYAVTAGPSPAVGAQDFPGAALPSGTVNFTDGQSSHLLTIAVQGDHFNESDEQLTVSLTGVGPGQSLGGTTSQAGLIVNDDTGLSVAARQLQQAEGSAPGELVAHEFTVTRSGIVTGETSFRYEVLGLGGAGLAVDAADFKDGVLPTGQATFTAGQTHMTLTVWTVQDTEVENDEGLRLRLFDASGNADIQQATADVVLMTDDSGLAIAADAATVAEGSQGLQAVRFTVTRTGDVSKISTVDWVLSGDLDASDLGAGAVTAGTLTFTVGANSASLSIPVRGDRSLEADEVMRVSLSNASAGAYVLPGQGTASTTVLNDDDRLTLVATALSANEGALGTDTPLSFTITRDAAGVLRDGTVVEWALDSTMLKPNDFELVGGLSQDRLGTNGGLPSGSVTFTAGQTTAVVSLLVRGDAAVERDETFHITVSTPSANTEFTHTNVTGVVTNDDFGFSVEAVDAVVAEGGILVDGVTSGTGARLVFSITRAGATDQVASVKWVLSGAAGLVDNDLVDGLGGLTEVTFSSGEVVKFITIAVQGDTTVEADETLVMTISDARNLTLGTGANIVDATATITVRNDDQQFEARVSGAGTSATVQEGGASSTVPLVFQVLRAGDVSGVSAVPYAVTGGTGVTPDDHQGSLPAGTLTFTAGQTSQLVTVIVKGDRLAEADEPYTLTLGTPAVGSVGNPSATLTVANDDTNYVLSPVANVLEGTGGTNHYTVTIERVGRLDVPGSVDWAVTARPGDALTAGDFVSATALPSGTASFSAHQTSVVLTLSINPDSNLESDEGMVITLTNPNQGTLEAGTLTQATAVILSDDDQFSIARASGQAQEIFEGNSGSTPVVLTITRTGALRGERTVSYAVTGTDIDADDFNGSPLNAAVTFADGQSIAHITLQVRGDSIKEDQETLVVTLSNPSDGATLNTASTQAQVRINNDDAVISVSAINPSQNEGNTIAGVVQPRPIVFNIVRDGYEFQESVFSYSVSGLTADDFYNNTLPAGTLTFSNGQITDKSLTLLLKADSVMEPDETLLLSLSNPSVGTQISPTAGSATQLIVNDDSEFNITAGTLTGAEGDGGHGTASAFVYTVTRTGPLNSTASVDWTLNSGAGQAGILDFTTGSTTYSNWPSGTLVFTSGQATANFTLYAYGDSGRHSVEGPESFVVSLSGPSDGSAIGALSSMTSTIIDDDTLVTATPTVIRQAEGIAGVDTSYVYTLTRTGNLDRSSVVSYSVTGEYNYEQGRQEYPADQADFVGGVFPSGLVTFTPGETVKTITVNVRGDNTLEEDEWFKVQLYPVSGVDEIRGQFQWDDHAQVLGEISRDEAKFAIVDVPLTGWSVFEGDSMIDGGTAAANLAMNDDQRAHVFKVTRTLSLNGAAWVDWAVGTGVAGYFSVQADDFVDNRFPTGRVSFTDGQSEGFITIWTRADDVGEFDEAFRVYFTGVSDGSSFDPEDGIGDDENRVLLRNDDTRFDISRGAPVTEGGSFVLTITRAGDVRGTDIAHWAVSFSGTELTNESSGNTGSWYRLDAADVGADAAAIVAAVTAEGMNLAYDSVNRRLTGEVLFLNGETRKTITISTLDDDLTETWRELLPASIITAHSPSSSTRNVTGSLMKLSGTFAVGDVVSVSVDGEVVSYSVTAEDVSSGGNTDTAYAHILSGLALALNTDSTAASLALARTYTLSTGAALFIEDKSPFATDSFIVSATQVSSEGLATVVAEVNADQETATPGFSDSQWVLDNEPDLITVSVNTDEVYENTDASTQKVVFTLTRTDNAATGNLNYPATVAWRFDGSGATWDVSTFEGTGTTVTYRSDYYQPNTIYGATAFTAGQTSALVTVTVNADAWVENDERMVFSLVDANTAYHYLILERGPDGHRADVQAWGSERDKFGPINVNTADAQSKASFTILNDDIRLYFNSVDENGHFNRYESTTSPVISITRSGVLDTTVVISYTVSRDGRSSEADDFASGVSGTLTLAAQTAHHGDVNYTFTLSNFFNNDTLAEGDEDFTLRLTAPGDTEGNHVRWNSSGSTTADVYGRIYDDDTAYEWSWVTHATQAEGNDGETQYMPFIAKLQRTAGYMGAAAVTWTLAPGHTVSASDFYNNVLPSGTIHFARHETEEVVTLLIRQDLLVEPDERFALLLTGGTLTEMSPHVVQVYDLASPTVTVVNDDTGLLISNASVAEVDEGATSSMVFTITRTGFINEGATVSWRVTDTGGNGFAGSSDFDPSTVTGTLEFAAHQSSATVTVKVRGDNDAEADELFRLQVVSATNVEDTSYLSNPGTGTILNDDSAFRITADQPDGALESAVHTFTVTRTHSTVQDQVVSWRLVATSTGDDADAADFTGGLVSGNLTFTPGVTALTLTVPVISDATFEFDEHYQVELTLGAGTPNDTLTVASAQGTIVNDDTAFGLVVSQSSRLEGEGEVVFTVNRVGELSGTSTVLFALNPGPGFDASDHSGSLPANQTLTFGAGVTSQSFTIQVSDDNLLETDERLVATLSGATGASVIASQASATVTLLNDDALFTLSRVSGELDADEGTGASRDIVLRVTRTGYLDSSGSVDWAITPAGADAQADFLSDLSGSLLFAAGETARDITLTIAGDAIQEADEVFTVSLSTTSTGFAVHADSAQTLTLRNDDTRFDLVAVGATTVTENDPTSTPAHVPVVFRVERTGRTSAEQVVSWTVQGQGADPASAEDFLATAGTVTFAANFVGARLFTVYVRGDLEGEADEGFTVAISGEGLEFGVRSLDGLIVDDEASFSVRRHVQGGTPDPDAHEGQTGEVAFVFDVIRAGNVASSTSTVSWSVLGDMDADDFIGGVIPSGHLTFTAGETFQTVTVRVKGDSTIEADEQLVLALSAPSADADVVAARSQATYTVLSDDTSWTLEAVTTPTVESDTRSGHVYRVVRTGGLYATTIGYSVSGVGPDAASADDFVGSGFPSGTITFAAGQATSALFTVQVAGDSMLEASESFELALQAPASDGVPRVDVFAVQSLTATIVDDDDVIGITAASTTVTEGDAGSTPVTFTLTREGNLNGSSTMGWRVRAAAADNQAGPSDFVVGSGTVTFSDGQSELTLTLQVQADMDVEDDESFVVELLNPGAGSTVKTGAGSASGTITNNDIDLRVLAEIGQAHEGDTVAGVMTFRVVRTGLLSGETTVDYAVSGIGGSAANAADFKDGVLPMGTLTFTAGESVAWITVTTQPDGDFEASETFQVRLSNPSGNAQVEVASATGLIVNDDDRLEVLPHAASGVEGTDTLAATYTDFVFLVSRTGSAIGEASASWTVTPGPGRALSVDTEVLATTGTVSFSDGQSEAFITIGVLADAVGEYAENFLVSLSNPSFGSTLIGAPAQGSVLNDDPVLSITANQPSKAEGNTNGPDTPFVFTVTRTGNTAGASTARWQVSGVASGESVDPVDFGGYMPSGIVVFTAGQVSQTLTVMVLADRMGELDEGFIVTLSDPTGADLLDERVATMQILNDDTLVSISAVSSALPEGAAGSTTPASFVLTREGDFSQASTVQWRVQGVSTAQVTPEDFAPGQDGLGNAGLPSGTVSFSAGQTSATVLIQVEGDAQHAPDETFRVSLSQPSIGAIRGGPATFTIVNDDALISLDTTPQLGSEGGTVQFALTRSGTGLALSSAVVVGWAVSGHGENAASAADFGTTSGWVTFTAGQTAAVVNLQLSADALLERDEQFRIALTTVPTGNASFAPTAQVALGAITDENVGVWLTAVQSQVLEGSQASGVTPFVVEVHRAGRLDQATALTLDISGAGLLPASADDFTSTRLAVTFAAGSSASQQVTLGIVHDAAGEPDETFAVSIAPGAGYTVLGGPLSGTILNDDGTSGSDVIHGSAGNDVLRGGPGHDVLYGNGGNDVFVFEAPSEGVDILMDFQPSDLVVFKASAFGNLALNEVQNLAGTLDQVLAALASGAGDVDFLRINVSGEFQFTAGAAGHLDELEAAITAGQASGPGFVAVGANNGPVHLYYDANMGAGTDGTGLQEIAVLVSLTDAHQLQLQPHAG